jgi:alpha-D-ribose 1-methylphosphonate 5-triphosphate synthase subunit PhnL
MHPPTYRAFQVQSGQVHVFHSGQTTQLTGNRTRKAVAIQQQGRQVCEEP